MKVYHGRTDIKRFEHLVETPSQTVTHLVLPAGQAIGQHHVPYTVVVVSVKGRILFSDEKETAEIYPGVIIRMAPHEVHSLEAVEDSELMVIKSHLAPEA